MRLATTLLVGVAASLALLAQSAAAEVVVVSEATSGDCDSCGVHASSTSNVDLIAHVPPVGEIPISRCDNEFEASIGADGEGSIYSQSLTGLGCTTTPCLFTPWPFHIDESIISHVETLRVTFCVVRAGMTILCDANVGVDASTHTVHFSAFESPCINLDGAIEVTGTWDSEVDGSHDALEFIH